MQASGAMTRADTGVPPTATTMQDMTSQATISARITFVTSADTSISTPMQATGAMTRARTGMPQPADTTLRATCPSILSAVTMPVSETVDTSTMLLTYTATRPNGRRTKRITGMHRRAVTRMKSPVLASIHTVTTTCATCATVSSR